MYWEISKTNPIARKEHKCIWCGEKILVGEKYEHEISTYNGNFQNHHWHIECVKAWGDSQYDMDYEFDAHNNERPARR